MSNCKSCGAPILWAKTLAGKAIPLDPKPHPDGNIALMLPAETVALGKKIGTTRYRSHFATCPNAASHRKPREVPTP